MKGVILAGGTGSRLRPMTSAICKQLLPVYDKPMIHYPLSTLMLAGVREILVVSRPVDRPLFEMLLGDGSHIGLKIHYAEQPEPQGIAQALVIGADFLAGEPCCLILGDNIFFGNGLPDLLRSCLSEPSGATILAYKVPDPERYGVVTFDEDLRVLDLQEKPESPQSAWAATGIYFLDGNAPKIAASLTPSARGELEITDVNRAYMARGELRVKLMGRGYAWLDAGTPESLLESAQFVRTLEKRQGMKIGCPEEIAFRQEWITREDLGVLADRFGSGDYASYLRSI